MRVAGVPHFFLFRRFSPVSTTRDFLGPFQLVRMIRSGTTTQVWEALQQTDRGARERVALKVLTREFCKDKEQIEYLKHEVNVGKGLDHPNVIKIFDYHEMYSLPFIAMQLFNARNLKIELRERPNEIAINLPGIIRKCAEGIRYLHECGWVHCDIKPDNFLADEQGAVKLIDFSIATAMPKKGLAGLFGGAKRPKTIRGTRSYMSPEQIRRQKLDERSDIYSFGCVVFELLAGRAPYSATNPDDLLNKHLFAPIPNLLAVSGATTELAKLVGRMLSKEPDQRPQSMSEFIIEFSRTGVFRAGKRPTGLVKDVDAD